MLVRGIHVKRDRVPILEDVSFAIPDGRVLAVLGPSGVGKTTLLRVLAGLDRPERGTVRDDDGRPFARRDVGIVFQDYPLLRHRTVDENLALAARIGGIDRERARGRIDELLARIGLEDHAGRYPAQLSGGERQRAAIAQQLVLPRRVLLLDEPFSGLDPAALADVSALVGELAGGPEPTTVVIVTHDIRAALAVSDAIVVLDRSGASGGARVRATHDLRAGARDLEPEITACFRRKAA